MIPDFVLNIYEASRFVPPPPIGYTPLTDATDKETNEWTNEQSLCPSVRPSVS